MVNQQKTEKYIYDNELAVTYRALSCCNDSVFADRCLDRNAPKVIWAINATAQLNNDMALALREAFKQGRINLLVSEFEAEEVLRDRRKQELLDALAAYEASDYDRSYLRQNTNNDDNLHRYYGSYRFVEP